MSKVTFIAKFLRVRSGRHFLQSRPFINDYVERHIVRMTPEVTLQRVRANIGRMSHRKKEIELRNPTLHVMKNMSCPCSHDTVNLSSSISSEASVKPL